MNQQEILNQIASLQRLDEVVLRHVILDMAVTAFSSPDGLAHQTMHLAKIAYTGLPTPQNGVAGHPALPPAPVRKLGRPIKHLATPEETPLVEAGNGHPPDGFISRKEAAARKGVSMATIDRLKKEGHLHVVKFPRGNGHPGPARIGIRIAELDAVDVEGRATVPPRREEGLDLTPAEWRAEILEYARQHDGVFRTEDYRKVYSLKFPNHVPMGKSRQSMTLNDMVARRKFLKNIGRAVYRITAKGNSFSEDNVRTSPLAPPPPAAKAPVKTRGIPGGTREWILGYARSHRGIVVAKEIKADYRAQFGKEITGGKLYDELNDKKLFRKEGTERGKMRFVFIGSAAAAPRKTLSRRPTPGRRIALDGLADDILAYTVQHGGEIVMKDYNAHFDKQFPDGGGAATRTGSIYGAVSFLINTRKLEKVTKGVYRTPNPRQEEAEEPAVKSEEWESPAARDESAAAAIHE